MSNQGILVCGEIAEGKLAPITLELLGIGRKLANDLGQELNILLMGSGIGNLAQEAIAFGADKVHVADNALLQEYNSDAYTAVAAKLCQKISPDIVLLGQTDGGRDLAPRLAGRLGGGLAMDCLELSIDPSTKLLVQTRPVFGGNANARIVSKAARPQMATIRSKTMAPAVRDDSRKGQVIPVEDIDASTVKVKVLERVKEKTEGVKLEDAEVVVSGGRGIGNAQNFQVLRDLANLLNGAVGATRAACEEGWIPMTHQVGQTGKIVSPKLYIAVALSGAMQHIAGCSGSKCVIAVNKDGGANIFKIATYGIVGDYKEVIPALSQKLKELLGK
jgi:electron transfer flavoprotein alpha subunit